MHLGSIFWLHIFQFETQLIIFMHDFLHFTFHLGSWLRQEFILSLTLIELWHNLLEVSFNFLIPLLKDKFLLFKIFILLHKCQLKA